VSPRFVYLAFLLAFSSLSPTFIILQSQAWYWVGLLGNWVGFFACCPPTLLAQIKLALCGSLNASTPVKLTWLTLFLGVLGSFLLAVSSNEFNYLSAALAFVLAVMVPSVAADCVDGYWLGLFLAAFLAAELAYLTISQNAMATCGTIFALLALLLQAGVSHSQALKFVSASADDTATSFSKLQVILQVLCIVLVLVGVWLLSANSCALGVVSLLAAGLATCPAWQIPTHIAATQLTAISLLMSASPFLLSSAFNSSSIEDVSGACLTLIGSWLGLLLSWSCARAADNFQAFFAFPNAWVAVVGTLITLVSGFTWVGARAAAGCPVRRNFSCTKSYRSNPILSFALRWSLWLAFPSCWPSCLCSALPIAI
jgi:hypothetical protein